MECGLGVDQMADALADRDSAHLFGDRMLQLTECGGFRTFSASRCFSCEGHLLGSTSPLSDVRHPPDGEGHE
jgi:hypothetical protein